MRSFQDFFKTLKKDFFDTLLAVHLALSMGIYGLGKLVQFKGAAALDEPLNQLSGMELMWAFYGYTLTYPLIIGAFEIIGGILVYFKKTRLIGCLLLTVILSNIIIQDIIYGVFALHVAIFYQLIVFYFLFKERNRLKSVFYKLIDFDSPKLTVLAVQTVLAIVLAMLFKMSTAL